jgi:hypothetical protein
MMPDVAKKSGPPQEKGKKLFCPSAQPDLPRSVILGVVGDTSSGEKRISFLKHLATVTDGTMAACATGVLRPTNIFRFAAPCEKSGCHNWSGTSCRVGQRLVQILPAVSEQLPDCQLRPVCRWFDQEGEQACYRCPQVITDQKDFERALNGSPGTLPATAGDEAGPRPLADRIPPETRL